jgi:hypothetical protein
MQCAKRWLGKAKHRAGLLRTAAATEALGASVVLYIRTSKCS